MKTKPALHRLAAALSAGVLITLTASAATAKTCEVTLNGLRISIDAQTGSILELEYPGPGKMLKTSQDYAGLVDLAYPLDKFEPLRRASRYSKNAEICIEKDAVTIHYGDLGASRPFELPGQVAVDVQMKALPDGQSILMTCTVDNQSDLAVPQVLFPDFLGLIPFEGEIWTEFRTCGFMIRPFGALKSLSHGNFYAMPGPDTVQYTGGAGYRSMIGRWLNFGGLTGGISLFPKAWAGAPNTTVRLHRTETHKTLRMHYVHNVNIQPGEKWSSAEYVLTPHKNGWAKGIIPYREFVHSKIDRIVPMPEHVKKGLGFRTIWLCKGYPADGDRDVDFHFTDLPRVARESLKYGLDELVLWFWEPPFLLPKEPPYPHLGTEQELREAIEECKDIGVNVSLFISWMSISHPTAERYGVPVPPGGWNYHSEMVPQMNPHYADERATGGINTANELWQKDVRETCEWIFNEFSPSLCWDQVMDNPVSGELYALFKDLRAMARDIDPESTFSGESVLCVEKDADYLDYNWYWQLYGDRRAFANAFPSPRLNVNINRHIPSIKKGFMDNAYLNVFPSKPDNANGTAMIEDYPEVADALKTCADLHSRFELYFVKGTPVGKGVLTESKYGAYVSAYVLPDRVLMLVLNVIAEQGYELEVDLSPWLEADVDSFVVRHYDEKGELKNTENSDPQWAGSTGKLAQWEMTVFEFVPAESEDSGQ